MRWDCGPCHAGIAFTLFVAGCAGPPPSIDRSAYGAVAAASPEAVAAGVAVLRAGGNAIDAAVAISFALGVSEPAMSGLGGQTQMLVHTAARGAFVINGTSFAPAATPRDVTVEDLRGHRASTVPTTVKVLEHAWRRHGSGAITWPDLLRPAIEAAESGFVIGPFRHKVLLRHHRDLLDSPSTGSLFLRPDGTVPAPGERWTQPRLAATLRRVADGGAHEFYRGAMAREIADDMRANGGWLTAEDLAALPAPAEIPALHGRYRDHDVWTLPPPGGGWVLLRILHRLQRIEPARLQPGHPDRVPLLAGALDDGHRMRAERPVRDLERYEAEVAERIASDGSGETTHFSVVDGYGTAASVTASLNSYFGDRVAHAGLGVVYNDYMREFRVGQPEHPFAIRAGAMPYSSMSPTILTRDGQPRLVLGSPGSERIISAVTQVIQLWVDADLPVVEAVARARLHAAGNGRVLVEPGAATDGERRALVAGGFDLEDAAEELASPAGNPYFGGVHAVAFERDGWVGAADPRRDGVATRTAAARPTGPSSAP